MQKYRGLGLSTSTCVSSSWTLCWYLHCTSTPIQVPASAISSLLHLSALSSVLENTVFLGEIVLRLPDVTHALLRNKTEWQMTVRWAVEFSNDTKILSGSEDQLISLV